MKQQTLVCILLAGSLSGCRTHETTVFVERSANRDYVKIACDVYKYDHHSACLRTPKQMTADLEVRLTSAMLENPACKHVTISYTPVSEENEKYYLAGWSLIFHVGIDGRDIDYSHSVWSMFDNKTKKRFDGSLSDSVEAATQICILAARRGQALEAASYN
jgi:hypothetical protein